MPAITTKLGYVNAIDKHAEAAFVRPDANLARALANTAANDIPMINVDPLPGQLLAIQARLVGAKNILEIGTLAGYSTLWLSKSGAKVTCLEVSQKHADVAAENLRAAGLTPDIIVGEAINQLPKLVDQGKVYDMVFIDADWERQAEYFDWAVKLTRKSGCIFVDNVVSAIIRLREGKPEGSILDSVGADERVLATLVPRVYTSDDNVETMGFDGVIIAVVN
ncbi:hypothetical protein VHEMI04550 [[Torrubiella] hemipterigena]|uniref:O-methyltransferase n=1 Tax=[Torrubiella] hemipterigena TaxID=1531966 RepID=A0A0A1TGN8_9HYPO|nr:hypothetical protein VHEMI04550 [[Torrubiella] hemipterigena]